MACACSSTSRAQSSCRTAGDAREADPDDAAWRSRLRSLDLQAGLFGARRCRAGHLSRSSRQWPQRRRAAGSVDAARNGATMCARSATCSASRSPIVLGVSFGGMVAIAYATRHPAHPAKLILVSTEAAGGSYRERRVALFERFGGPEVGALARRDSSRSGQADHAALEAWRRLAMPHYTRIPRDPDWRARGSWPAGGAAVVHAARRRGPHVRHASRPRAHPMSDARHGRRGRSDDPDRVPGGHRGGAAGRIWFVSSGSRIAGTG